MSFAYWLCLHCTANKARYPADFIRLLKDGDELAYPDACQILISSVSESLSSAAQANCVEETCRSGRIINFSACEY